MIDVKATIAALRASGVPPEMIATVLECYQEVAVSVPQASSGNAPAESRLERLRAYDRERKRRKKDAKSKEPPAEKPAERKGGDIEILPVSRTLEEGKESVIAPATPSRWPEFKAAYPKRAGDYDWKKAGQKFEKLVGSGVQAQHLIDGAASYAKFCDAEGKTGTQYVRQPTTWLNNEGWKNDYTPSRKTGFLAAFDNLERKIGEHSGPRDGAGGPEPPDDSGLSY